MKKVLILSICIFSTISVYCQLHDQQWIIGRGPNLPHSYFGGVRCDFSKPDAPGVSYYTVPEMFSAHNNLTISDSAGNLLFFTNGCEIISHNNELMENGNELNMGETATYFCENGLHAYEGYQSLLSIPFPGRLGEYLLFHAAWEPFDTGDSEITYYFTHIDMNANGGLGKVIVKNQLMYGPDWMVPATAAVRHANGRDWWIMTGGYDNHIFRSWLVTPQGVGGMMVQDWNSLWAPNQNIALAGCFSPDGSKFVRAMNSYQPDRFFLFDFDRCDGRLYNPVPLELPDTLMAYAMPIFSPDSRFLYVSNRIISLYQFDLQAPDINASAVKVGDWDGIYDTTLTLDKIPGFHKMAQGTDGKIYISSYDHTIFLHVIHQPDQKGADCQLEQRGINLKIRNESLPNYPNYRLYDLPGSPCDTLGINTPVGAVVINPPENVNIGLYPNPADDLLTVAWPDAFRPKHLKIRDVSGREIYSGATMLPVSGNRASIGLDKLYPGLYFLTVQFENGATGTTVFSVMR